MPVIVRHSAAPKPTARIRLPREQLVRLGTLAALTVDGDSFHNNLRYLKSNGVSCRTIAQVVEHPHRSIVYWLNGTRPTDEHAVKVINKWAQDLRVFLEGLSSLRPSVSVSSQRVSFHMRQPMP